MIDDFTKGKPEARRILNELIRIVRGLEKMTGDGFVNVQRGPHPVISLNMNELKARMMNFGGSRDIRLAFSENAAAANTNAFDCFLDTDTTGESISVVPIVNTTVTALTLAAPRLFDGTPLAVWQDGAGAWRTAFTFEKAGPC